MNELLLSAERLRQLLDYDAATGIFIWKEKPGKNIPRGSIAGGAMRTGHIRICIMRVKYLAHRLAWLYVTGSWPSQDIDHIDGDPTNNRFANLREVTHQENMQNVRVASVRTSTGMLGVSWCPRNRKWRADISFNGKNRHLGLHETQEAAHEAYVVAKRQLHPGCTI